VTDAPGPVKTKRSDRPLNTSLCLGDNWRCIQGCDSLAPTASLTEGARGGRPNTRRRNKVPISFAGGSLA